MTSPDNPLERALRAAASDPASRPDFYRLLIESEVFVISGDAPRPHGERTIEAGEKLTLQSWERSDGSRVIPLFTSIAALERAITEPCGYLGLPARSLFELARGATLFLNPKLEHGKEFLAQEVEALLSGGMTRMPEERVTQQERRVLLGQPQNHPTAMVEALAAFLRKRSEVKAAYLILMHDEAQDRRPHLVVGVQADGDTEHLFREIGVVAADTAPAGEAVDLYRVVPGDEGLSAYFLGEVKPFYERALSARLRGLFGSRGG